MKSEKQKQFEQKLAEIKQSGKIKPGQTFYQIGDRRKYHIVAILDEPDKQVVIKYFGIHKQWWHYEVKSLYILEQELTLGLSGLKRKDLKNQHVFPN